MDFCLVPRQALLHAHADGGCNCLVIVGQVAAKLGCTLSPFDFGLQDFRRHHDVGHRLFLVGRVAAQRAFGT